MFDRLYGRWAVHALGKGSKPPSRERWDVTILFLLSSHDPDRIARYSRIDAPGDSSLGADAYELWGKMPDYTPNLYAPVRSREELSAYKAAHSGSMKRLMQERGLGERYDEIIAAQQEHARLLQERGKRAQQSLIAMGCAGIGFIIMMMLGVFVVIALRFTL